MMQKFSPSLRIIVLGAQEVGKSALTVRFLTQRFIGEYSSQKDLLYCSRAQVDNCSVDLEMLDTSRDQTDCIPQEKVHWADGYAVVYSISSRSSFLVAADCLRHLSHQTNSQNSSSVLLIGNKKDLEHCREVSLNEGQRLAKEFGCSFSEVSAAEGLSDVVSAFQTLLREVRELKAISSPKRKISVVSVSKIISAVFGRTSVVSDHQQNHRQKKRPSLSL